MAVRVGGVVFGVKANVSQATKAFFQMGKAAKGLQNNLRQTKNLFGGLSDQTKKASRAIAGFAAALGGAAIFQKVKEFTLLAARVQNLGTVLDNVGRIAGLNSAQIRNVEDSVRRLGITAKSARQSLSQLAQANISLTKATQLTRIAQDAAVIAGIDSSEAFNRLVVSVQRNDVRLLRNLGIVINLNQVYTKFAQTTGRTAASLTAFEKRQLVLNEVIKRGAQITGTYEASLQDAFKQFTSLNRLAEEAARFFGDQFVPVFEKVVKVTGDWLKAFVAGQTIIGPRFLGVVAAAAIALTAFTVVVGALAAAFAAVSIAGGPVTIALIALAAVIVGGVALWANYKLKVAEAEAALKAVEAQAEQTAQALFEANVSLEKIKKLGDSELESDLATLREEGSKLAVLFPDLADKINDALDAGDSEKLVAIFEKEMPRALNSTEENLESFQKQRMKAEKDFQQALKDTFRIEEGFSSKRKAQQRKEFGESGSQFGRGDPGARRRAIPEGEEKFLSDRVAARRAQEKFNEASRDTTEQTIKQNAVLVEENETLKESAALFLEAERAITQLRQAKLTAIAQEFQVGLDELEQAGNQANQIIRKLENERDRIFKGTNLKIIRDFEAAQAQLIAVEFDTEEKILAARAAFEIAQSQQAKTIRDRKLTALEAARKEELKAEKAARLEAGADEEDEDVKEAQETRLKNLEGFNKKKGVILRQFAAESRRINAQAEALEETGIASLTASFKAQALASETVTKQLEKQEAATARLLEISRLEALGIGPKLLKIRERFAKQTERLNAVTGELASSMFRIQDQIVKTTGLSLDTITAVIDGALDPAILAPKTRKLIERFGIVERAINANQNELLAREKKFNAEFEAERKRLSDKLIDEEKKLSKARINLADLTGKAVKESTFDGLRAQALAIEEQTKETKKFLQEANTELLEIGEVNKTVQNKILAGRFKTIAEFDRALGRLRRNALPGIKDIRDEFTKFQEAAKKATTASDLKQIANIFGQNVEQKIVGARIELKRLQTTLLEFQKIGRPKQERDDRIENQRLFNELVDQGVPIFKARQEIQRKELEQRKALNVEEDELKNKVKEQQQAARRLAEERTALEVKFQETLVLQTAEIQKQFDLRKKLLEIQKAELAENARKQAENKKAQAELGKVAPAPGTTTGAPGAPGATAAKTPLEKTTSGLTKEAAALAAATERTALALDEGLAQTQRSLRLTRQAADNRLKILEDFIAEQIIRQGEAGKAKMRQADLIRRKT